MDVCRTAVRLGAENVYIVYRRSADEMPADKEEVAEAEAEDVVFKYLNAPVEVLGQDGQVCGLKVELMELGDPDEKGRRKPVGTGRFEILDVDTVLGAIGQTADWGSLLEGSKVVLNKKGYAEADSWTYQTAEPDIFVGGDIYTGPKFVIDAIAAGKEGADSLHRFVHEGHSLTLGRVRRDNFKYIDKNNVLIPLSGYDSAKRNRHGVDESKVKTFRDERLPFTEEQVKAEAARCLKCGAAWVDSNICIGCGLCTTRCKFDAIHLHKEYDAWGVPYEKLVGHVLKTTVQRVGRRVMKKDV
jgi:NADPH-dependent glutamate synthase beta subunit-like oxidoreductase